GKKEFHKHSVVLGQENGADVRVLSGFGPNSEIVIKGAYHIKLASMSSSLPALSFFGSETTIATCPARIILSGQSDSCGVGMTASSKSPGIRSGTMLLIVKVSP
ncbi:MAG: hypothetical protein QF437_20720, partial [Planctomycetota bacterium]|nr:hypothetical protein [Planctomycetota bacterium]